MEAMVGENHDVPVVSVLMIVHNLESYIGVALDALKNQTFKSYNVVIVNDGSTDKTAEVIKDFFDENSDIPHVFLQNSEKQGIVKSRNITLEHASGEYIYFYDGDDYMEPYCLEVLVNKAKEKNSDCVIAEFSDVDIEGNKLQVRNLPPHPCKWFYTMFHGILYRRKLIEDNNIYFIEKGWEDITFNYRLWMITDNVAYVYKSVLNYRISDFSTTSTNSLNEKKYDFEKFSLFLDFIIGIKPQLNDKYWVYVEYYVIKNYYSTLLRKVKGLTFKEAKKLYDLIHTEMNKKMQGYIKNKNVTLFKENYDRKYGKIVTYILIMLEKMRILKYCLGIYIFLTQKIYIPG